ncbi:YfbM family protein [Sphingomonas sp.]|uniref:YfbM family protein n=1 Tax=Sphingomonas sp. TaxID=28214 RepID=UPI0025D434FF|nr:YfbM family protein [Sphingomonas sp.]
MVIVLRRASSSDIERLIADPDDWETFVYEEGDQQNDIVDFDKAWHALHFMLTGAAYNTDSPLGIIANDGETIGTDENGFGGFTVVSPAQMKMFDEALRRIDDAELASHYDHAAMLEHDIYIADAFAGLTREEALEYIFQSLPALRDLTASCAKAGDGALRILT